MAPKDLYLKTVSVYFYYCCFLTISIIPQLALSVYPEHCSTTEDCYLGETCTESMCICDVLDKWQFDAKTGICVRSAGGSCSSANDDSKELEYWDCVENSICNKASNICECLPDYESTIYGECKKSLGTYCDDSELCNESGFLICDKSTSSCACLSPTKMVYDYDRKTCVSKVFEQCEFERWMGMRKDCTVNAACVYTDDHVDQGDRDFYGVCQCLEGFSLRNDTISHHLNKDVLESQYNGTKNDPHQVSLSCGKYYGESCSVHTDCFTGFCGESSRNSGSESRRICACPSTAIYDEEFQRCMTKPGENCRGNNVAEQICVRNATCDLHRGICKCLDSFFPTSDRKLCQFSEVPNGDTQIEEPQPSSGHNGDLGRSPSQGYTFRANVRLVVCVFSLIIYCCFT